MTDDQQRARAFMPEPRVLWVHGTPAKCVTGFTEQQMLAAITAALRAAPEGFVMVPVEPTREMIGACENQWSVGSATDMARREWMAMLAARPQGVKDE